MSIRSLLGYMALILSIVISTPVYSLVVAEPPSVDGWFLWGDVYLGETRTTTVILRNDSDTDEAVISDISLSYSVPPGFSINTDPTPITLAPSGFTSIGITYTPTFDSMTMGLIVVQVEAQGVINIDMFGSAIPADTETSCDDGIDNDSNGWTDCEDPVCQVLPECVVSPFTVYPSAISFRDVYAGTYDRQEEALAINNASDVPVQITEFSVTHSYFTFEPEPNCSEELAVGESCWVYITFDPETAGDFTADFVINFTTGIYSGAQSVALNGTGIPSGDIEVTPSSHDFGYQYPASAPVRINVENTSPNPITLREITRTTNAFDMDASCYAGLELSGYESCYIDVSFGPREELSLPGSEVTGQIIISAIDPDGPETVIELTGKVPESSWITEVLTYDDEVKTSVTANGIDLAESKDLSYRQVHLCYYTDRKLYYATSKPSLAPEWQIELIELLPTTGSRFVDCAIAAMPTAESPEIAYLVDDGNYIRIFHTHLGQDEITEVDSVFYDGANGYVIDKAEIDLAKDELDRTHLAYNVFDEGHLGINGFITRFSPAIPWSRSQMKTWELGSSINPYMGDHPYIGVTDDNEILLKFASPWLTLMHGSNFHYHPDSEKYIWDWEETVFINRHLSDSLAHVDFTPPILNVALHKPGDYDNGVFLQRYYWEEFDNAIETGPYFDTSPPPYLGIHLEETDHKLDYEQFAVSADNEQDQHAVFNSNGEVRYSYLKTGNEPSVDSIQVYALESDPVTKMIQLTEIVGPSGRDLKIKGFTPASREKAFVAYINGDGHLTFARRVEPPVLLADIAAPLSLSPMRETYGSGIVRNYANAVMLTNPTENDVTISLGNVELITQPVDEGKWLWGYCSFDYNPVPEGHYFIPSHSAIAFCVVLDQLEKPLHPIATFRVTTDGGTQLSTTLIAHDVLDTDSDGVSDLIEFTYGTDPFDADMDDDGLMDGPLFSEDLNGNGIFDLGETDPRQPDTDGDGLNDGLEKGLIEPQTEDTDVTAGFFSPDADPATQTDPTRGDTDNDELLDGEEDANHNGAFEPLLGETDPNAADTDNDGSNDGLDQCPNDSNKTLPGSCGCGVLDTDTDNDGTADCNDLCPVDPGKVQPGTCGCGVADTDTDGDGIADCVDNCVEVANPDQADEDNNGIGDACEIPIDVTPPVIALSVSPDTLWPPNHKMIPISVSVSVTDDIDPDPAISLTSVSFNEGDETNTYDPEYDLTVGDGNTVDDIVVDDNGNISLRAERSGTGDGRIYTIVYTATDSSGNVTTAIATVSVPHNQ